MKIEIKKRPLKLNRTTPIFIAIKNESTNPVVINRITLTVVGLNQPRQPAFRGMLAPDEVKYITVPLTVIPNSEHIKLSVNVEIIFDSKSENIQKTVEFILEEKQFQSTSETKALVELPDAALKTKVETCTNQEAPENDDENNEKENLPDEREKNNIDTVHKSKNFSRVERIKSSFVDEAAKLLEL